MYYFEQFKTAIYNIDGGSEWTLVTDILKRVRLRSNIKKNVTLLDCCSETWNIKKEHIEERIQLETLEVQKIFFLKKLEMDLQNF